MNTAPIRQAIHAAAIDQCMSIIAERLERAAEVAKSAVACMQDGKREQAVTIVMGVEEMVIHVNTFLNAAALIRRNAEL